jgi:hypothetical protein
MTTVRSESNEKRYELQYRNKGVFVVKTESECIARFGEEGWEDILLGFREGIEAVELED